MPGFELFGDRERAETRDVLDSGVLMRYGFDAMRNGHWKAREMESLLATRMQVKHAQLLSSGTAALTVAMASCGIGAGDEVILPVFTFVASFEAVLAVGAVPVLVDIDDTLTLDPQSVRKAITDKTRVVMPVHMCGSMADLDALQTICEEYGLILLEDACQAIGGTYKGKPLGSIGDVGCFSFDYVKTVTCGEGGALITNDPEIYRRADHYSDHGHDHTGTDRGAEEHPFLGYNFRISELNAAVGLAQLRRIDEFLKIQEMNYSILKEGLQDIQGIEFRRIPEGGTQNYSFLNFFLADEEKARLAIRELAAAGVDSCFYWYDNNWHYHKKWDHLKQMKSLGHLGEEVLQGIKNWRKKDFSISDNWMSRTISCLVKLSWSREEVLQRSERMRLVLRNL
ncbi:MAG: DegT/DnrJ/EryC1/StrS family aminotransferase [Flavobacteriaceae bacterium]